MTAADSETSRGRWPLVLTIMLALIGGGGMLAWGIAGVLIGDPPIGGGSDPAAYGVDLGGALVEADAIKATGNPRDFLFVYEAPGTLPGAEVAAWNADNSRKWQKEVVSTDRVVGVEIAGESRAYPLFILDAHEIILDELGGVPIIVARSPLIDEAMVFDRRLPNGELLDPGVSGLLDDLSLLMHDGRSKTSLWSAHDGRAIAGPRIGQDLSPVPGVGILRWRDWLAAHPSTTVVVREPESMRRYRRIDYRRYLDGDDWMVPPRREPSSETADGLASRTRILSVLSADGELLAVLPLEEVRSNAVDDRLQLDLDGRRLVLQPTATGEGAWVVEADGLLTRPGMWVGIWARDPDLARQALERGRRTIQGESTSG